MILDVLDVAASMYAESVLQHNVQIDWKSNSVDMTKDEKSSHHTCDIFFHADVCNVIIVNFFTLVRNVCLSLPYTRVKVKQMMFNDINSIEVASWITCRSANISNSLLAIGELYTMGLIRHQKLKMSHIIHLFCNSNDMETRYSSSILLGLLLRLPPPFIHHLTGKYRS